MDDATEQLLIEMGVFRDLRCPYCDAKDVTTITVFERPARHRCCLCKREFSDDESERKEKGMTNVTEVKGHIPVEYKIKDMKRGEVGYTVPWAYKDGNLNEEYTISDKGGTVSLRVECVKPGSYSLTFEEPEYRPIRI